MIRLQNVNFETGKATCCPSRSRRSTSSARSSRKWPELKIEIGGHTDSRGSDADNQKLSRGARGLGARLPDRKVPGAQGRRSSRVKGYGESKPIVPNTNELNMAKNRRVEFVVLNKDVLKRESERRRLLKAGESTTPAVPVPTPTPPAPTPAPPDTTKKK